MYCWILRTSAAPSLAAWPSARRWPWGSGGAPRWTRSARSSSAWPTTAVSRLLKSWAIPIAIRPSISIRRRRVCSAAHDAGSRKTSPVTETGYRPGSRSGSRTGWKCRSTGVGASPSARSARNTWCVTSAPRAASTTYSWANRASSAGSRSHSPSSPNTSRHASLPSSRPPAAVASAARTSGATKGTGAGSMAQASRIREIASGRSMRAARATCPPRPRRDRLAARPRQRGARRGRVLTGSAPGTG